MLSSSLVFTSYFISKTIRTKLKIQTHKTLTLLIILHSFLLSWRNRDKSFQNKVLWRIFWSNRKQETGKLRKLNNKLVHILYSPPIADRNVDPSCPFMDSTTYGLETIKVQEFESWVSFWPFTASVRVRCVCKSEIWNNFKFLFIYHDKKPFHITHNSTNFHPYYALWWTNMNMLMNLMLHGVRLCNLSFLCEEMTDG